VITSDLKALPFVDLVARGEELPFRDGALRAVYGINVFHHLADIESFFSEIIRAVAPGGGCVLVEPFHGPLARVLFPNLSTMESYCPEALSWGSGDRSRPASQANQALSYVVLRRGLSAWSERFPQLRLVSDAPHTHLSYLLSGGVNFRQLVPTVLGRAAAAVERRTHLLNGFFGLQHTLVILRQ
jgi:SAM-dependent methyltransferase